MISFKLFGESGVKALKNAEEHHKRFFLWASEFSNVHTTFPFDEFSIIVDGEEYAGPEHYFQQQKSVGTKDEEKAKVLMKGANPDQVYGIGRACAMRHDWETVKDDIMYAALYAKFSQNEGLKNLLLETGDHLLVQMKPNDAYWGTGSNGQGQNMHATILMKVRDAVRNDEIKKRVGNQQSDIDVSDFDIRWK